MCASQVPGVGTATQDTYINVHRLLVAHINPLQMTLTEGSQATFTCRATHYTDINEVCISFTYNSDVQEYCNKGDWHHTCCI